MDFDNYLIDEINVLLKEKIGNISKKYAFKQNPNELYNKFELKTINIIDTKQKILRKSSEIPEGNTRCQGRIWANGKTVKENGKWIYGAQCKRKHKPDEKYCGIHIRSLAHGNFFEAVPHDHFDKFKFNNL